MRSRIRGTVFLLFFLSGAAGLMYEVSWARLLGLFMGNTAYAQAVVIGVFMGGLALGSVWIGRAGDRNDRPLRLYAWLELGVGVYGLLLPSLIGVCSNLYVRVASATQLEGAQLTWLRVLISAAVLLVPTFLMGGTLPVLSKFFVQHAERTREGVARLYYLNSFGAIVGSLVAGFALIHLVGIHNTIYVAAGINLVVALFAWKLQSKPLPATEDESEESEAPAGDYRVSPAQYRCVLIALFLSGFAAMVYEVCFVRMIAIGFGSTVYSFTVMLAAFIAGVTIGSAAMSTMEVGRYDRYFGFVQWGIVAIFLLQMPIYRRYPYIAMQVRTMFAETPTGFYLCELAKFVYVLLSLALPTLLIGMTFPLAAQINATDTATLGRKVGSVYGFNTTGNLLGAIGGGVILLPLLGLERTFAAALLVNFVAGALVLGFLAQWSFVRRMLTIVGGGAVCAVLIWYHRGWTMAINQSVDQLRVHGDIPSSFEKYVQRHVAKTPIFLGEDANATVVVSDHSSDRWLAINSKIEASRHFDLTSQLLQAHIPLLFHPNPQQVLIVGLGSGISAGAVLQHPVAHLDLVELSPAVTHAARAFDFDNDHVLDDPRLRLHIEDGRTFLKTCRRTYDVILNQPSNPWIAGVGNLFSVEYFRDCLAHLNEDGIMMMWFHEYEMDDDTLKIAARTFLDVFPQVTLWSICDGDIMLLGSRKPLPNDWTKMESRVAGPNVSRSLQRIQVVDLSTILAHQCHDDSTTRRLIGSGRVNSQFHPLLDFLAPRMFFMNASSPYLSEEFDTMYGNGRLPPLIVDFARHHALTRHEYERFVRQLEPDYPENHAIRRFYVRKLMETTGVVLPERK